MMYDIRSLLLADADAGAIGWAKPKVVIEPSPEAQWRRKHRRGRSSSFRRRVGWRSRRGYLRSARGRRARAGWRSRREGPALAGGLVIARRHAHHQQFMTTTEEPQLHVDPAP